MAKVIIGPQTGEVVEDGKVIRKDYQMWCEVCLVKKIQSGQVLSKSDVKYVKSCEMRDWGGTDKDGSETRGKTCPRCRQTIVWNGNGWEGAHRA